MPISIERTRLFAEAMDLSYPLYADPSWHLFNAYGTSHSGPLPTQAWAILDGDGIIRWLYRARVKGTDVWEKGLPMPMDVLEMVGRVLPESTK